jgi:SMODS and SLOG-associating 2TM effector domain
MSPSDVEKSPGKGQANPPIDSSKTYSMTDFTIHGPPPNEHHGISPPTQSPPPPQISPQYRDFTSPSTSTSPPTPAKPIARQPTQFQLSNASKLELFRNEIGITAVTDVPKNARAATNKGVYHECVSELHKMKFLYWLCATILNLCLLLQVAIGASLTALGASSGGKLAITILGATNTVIASILTYLKAQGLPFRLLAYLNELKRVRAAIELKERDFVVGRWKDSEGKPVDVYKVVDDLVKLYEDAKTNSESNHPETYTASAGTGPGTGTGMEREGAKRVLEGEGNRRDAGAGAYHDASGSKDERVEMRGGHGTWTGNGGRIRRVGRGSEGERGYDGADEDKAVMGRYRDED